VTFEGVPDSTANDTLTRLLAGLPSVVNVAPARPRVYELQMAGTGPVADLVAAGVLKPLNAQLGQACFSLGAVAVDRISVQFDPRCTEPSVLSRLETNPPAGLYSAPSARQKDVIKNPEMLKKLMI
jgi:hypothetical protein